ncbi:MAG TPA: tetratricopeptide repeat protein, partial [Vicinamibacterales bacterium]|nr:tetratricopeptide repeat protein [Vicinamibacterales bacterium]
MSEVRDVSFAIRAAEEAAGAGDFLTAEQYLSRAVELEEVSFGPMHAELASILNNLGVVYERLDRPDKAEACYRRAYAIAKASLPPGDPGIELSATNLREFCEARGIPFEPSAFAQEAAADQPASAQSATAEKPAAEVAPALPPPSPLRAVHEPVVPVPKKAPMEPELPRDAVPVEAREPAALMAPRTLAISALVVVAVIVGVIFVATRS